MGNLTTVQKMLRPIINWTVERFFPNGAFYGHSFHNAFIEVNRGSKLGQASVSWIVHNMHEMNAESVKFELNGMSINGILVGDFVITGELSNRPDNA